VVERSPGSPGYTQARFLTHPCFWISMTTALALLPVVFTPARRPTLYVGLLFPLRDRFFRTDGLIKAWQAPPRPFCSQSSALAGVHPRCSPPLVSRETWPNWRARGRSSVQRNFSSLRPRRPTWRKSSRGFFISPHSSKVFLSTFPPSPVATCEVVPARRSVDISSSL